MTRETAWGAFVHPLAPGRGRFVALLRLVTEALNEAQRWALRPPAHRPHPVTDPVAVVCGVPVWYDHSCPRDTGYVLGLWRDVPDPPDPWPTIAGGVR